MKRGRRAAEETLPPHSAEAEAGLLGCVLLNPHDCMVKCLEKRVSAAWFYVTAHRDLWPHLVALHEGRKAPDLVSLVQRLRDTGELESLGGLPWLSSLENATPSAANLDYYVEIVREKSELRWQLQRAAEIRDKITAGGTPEELRELLRESSERIDSGLARAAEGNRPVLEVVGPDEVEKFKFNGEHLLIGDTDFRSGYEGLTVIGGPPGSGKSLLTATLALAGARGTGQWMGRKIHRKFRVLIMGAENGRMRWQRDFREMAAQNPKADLQKWVRVVLPPEGGLCFHRHEFRRAVKAAVKDFKPDMVILDPWTSVAVDDTSKDVVDKLAEIRSCFGPGDECPSLVIVAHTKKPRQEDKGNRGRALMYSIAGSQALVSTARCVYVLLPYTDDINDHRVLWCCSKLSDGTAEEDRVFLRVLGREFPPTTDDPAAYWEDGHRESGVWLTVDMVKTALGDASRGFTVHGLAKHLADEHHEGRGVSSVHKWLKGPEFAGHLKRQGSFVVWEDKP